MIMSHRPLRIAAAFFCLLLSAGAYAAPQLAISPLGYQIIQLQGVPGNPRVFDVTARAGVVNLGDPATAVTARLMSSSSSFIVLDGDVSFGNVPRTTLWRPVISLDTFKLRVILPANRNRNSIIEFIQAIHHSLSWQVSCGNCGINRPPVANAGADQTVYATQTVTLDGSGSTDPDGQALTYAWSFVSRPAGSAAALAGATNVKPTFVPDRDGSYVVQLIVKDGQLSSSPDTVEISTLNSAPVANAGADQAALTGQAVTLDGSASSDIDGDSLTYAWSIVTAPAGSQALIANPAHVKPTFTPDLAGQYVIQLIVDDGTVPSAPDTMVITTTKQNGQPVANAGADQTVHVGDTAHLDGSTSSDPDGDALTYRWSLNARPTNSNSALQGATSPSPTLPIDKPGTYVAQLIVSDGVADSSPDTVSLSTTNSAPVASASAPASVHWNTTVQVDGSASTDVDGDALGFTWSILTRPAGSQAVLSDPNAIKPTFQADRPGVYVVQLVVNDGHVNSAPASASVTATNQVPVARDDSATTSANVAVDINVLGNDTDADGDTLSIASVTQPAHGTASINGASAHYVPATGFSGSDSFSYNVTDGADSASATVAVTVTGAANAPPIADAGPDQSGYAGDTFTLDGRNSHDPEGAPLIYHWTILSGPAGAQLINATSAQPQLQTIAAGTYGLSLVVNDGVSDSAADQVQVIAAALPTLSIADASIVEGNSGVTNLVLQVTLSSAINRTVSASYGTSDGSASSATDFTPAAGVVSFPANSTAPQTVSVAINGDTAVEPDETFSVTLSSPANATLARATALGTIRNDDAAPSGLQLTLSRTSLSRGDVLVAKLTLPQIAPTDTLVSLANTNPGALDTPAQLIVPLGETVAAFALEGHLAGTATVTASAPGLTPASATLTVLDRNFSMEAPIALNAGVTAAGTLTLEAPAPTGGASFHLSLSDATKLTVDATATIPEGGLRGTFSIAGVAAGDVEITATALTGAVGSASTHLAIAVAATDNTKTSDALIEADRAGGLITDEQAFVYRVLATFGSPQLPAQYRGRISERLDSSLRNEINQQYPTLSAAAKAAIVPYLMPPIYAGSWGDPNLQLGPLTLGKPGNSLAQKAGAPILSATTPTDPNPCASTEPPLPGVLTGWARLTTQRFHIWYQTNVPTAGFSEVAAMNLAMDADNVYASLVGLMLAPPRDLPSDANVACNGGDGKIDVYVAEFSGAGLTRAYPGVACTQGPSPAYILLPPHAIMDPTVARDRFTHEFMHLVQFAFGRGGPCKDYGWLEEGTANWAMEYVHHEDDFEKRYSIGYFFQQISPRMGITIPIDLDLVATGSELCIGGYCSYPLFQYIARTYDPSRIRRIFEATESQDAIASIATAVGSGGSMRDVWHDFSRAAYNDHASHIADDFYQWDTDPSGFRNTSIPESPRSVVDVSLQGQKTVDLSPKLYNALKRIDPQEEGHVPLYRLANKLVDLKFSDTNVRRAVFTNPLASAFPDPDIKIWAIQRINGGWSAPEDWTNKKEKVFCRDKPEERIEELVLIYSNGNSSGRGTGSESMSDLDSLGDPDSSLTPQLRVSTFPCGRWTGNTRVRVNYDSGGFTEYTAHVTLERVEDQTGEPIDETIDAAQLVPRPGTSTATVVAVDVGSSTGCSQSVDFATGPIAPTDARVNVEFVNGTFAGGGITVIQNTVHTLACAGSDPIVAIGPTPSSWLIFPQTGALIDADGRSINGSETIRIAGATQTSEWHLQAERQ